MPIRFPFLVALLFITALTAFAQDDDVIRTNTDNVVLNVTVTDKSGQYVKGLKASDFKVYENGVEVKTEMFEKLVPAMEKLKNPTENKAGRAHLVTFCATYYRNEHLPRTPQKARAGARVGVRFS